MSDQVKILGITLDSTMTLDGQIAATCRSSYMQYEGQLKYMEEHIPHPIRPLVRSHGYHPYFAAAGRAETDSFNFDRRGRRLRTVLTRFEARGVLPAVGPVRPALSSPDELPAAR